MQNSLNTKQIKTHILRLVLVILGCLGMLSSCTYYTNAWQKLTPKAKLALKKVRAQGLVKYKREGAEDISDDIMLYGSSEEIKYVIYTLTRNKCALGGKYCSLRHVAWPRLCSYMKYILESDETRKPIRPIEMDLDDAMQYASELGLENVMSFLVYMGASAHKYEQMSHKCDDDCIPYISPMHCCEYPPVPQVDPTKYAAEAKLKSKAQRALKNVLDKGLVEYKRKHAEDISGYLVRSSVETKHVMYALTQNKCFLGARHCRLRVTALPALCIMMDNFLESDKPHKSDLDNAKRLASELGLENVMSFLVQMGASEDKYHQTSSHKCDDVCARIVRSCCYFGPYEDPTKYAAKAKLKPKARRALKKVLAKGLVKHPWREDYLEDITGYLLDYPVETKYVMYALTQNKCMLGDDYNLLRIGTLPSLCDRLNKILKSDNPSIIDLDFAKRLASELDFENVMSFLVYMGASAHKYNKPWSTQENNKSEAQLPPSLEESWQRMLIPN